MFPSKNYAPKEFLEMRKKMIKDNLPKDLILNEKEMKLLGLVKEDLNDDEEEDMIQSTSSSFCSIQ